MSVQIKPRAPIGRIRQRTPASLFWKQVKTAFSMWQLYVLILPALTYIVLFEFFPMYGLQIAFKNYRVSLGIIDSEWMGLKHFERFLNYPDFEKIISNTMRISFKSMLWGFPFPIILALMINELRNQKFKKVVQMVSYMPHFISTVTVCGIVLLMFDRQYGVINGLITSFGGERIDWLGSAGKYFDALFIGSGLWQGVGFSAIIYISALSAVSPELVESAKIDGASRFKIIQHINIPAILPTIVISLILRCGSILSVGFEKVFALQNPLNMSISTVISTYTYNIGLGEGQFSYASAIGLFNTLVNISLLLVVNYISKKLTDTGLL